MKQRRNLTLSDKETQTEESQDVPVYDSHNRYNPAARCSILEMESLQGYINLSSVLLLSWGAYHLYWNYTTYGELIDWSLFSFLMANFHIYLVVWIVLSINYLRCNVQLYLPLQMFAFCTFFVVILEKLAPKLPKLLLYSLYISYQLFHFYASVYIVTALDWSPLLRLSIALQVCVLSMKMHSYFMTHREAEGLSTSLLNYFQFLCFPTLLYSPSYPRKTSIDLYSISVNWITASSAFLLQYLLTQDVIRPIIEDFHDGKINMLGVFIQLGFPTIVFWLLLFYGDTFFSTITFGIMLLNLILSGIFHGLLNGWAELCRFADREFYTDWWNANSFDVFWVRWNRPVYKFMHRHVYYEGMHRLGFSKMRSQFATFLVTAVLHEFVVDMVVGVVRPYLFLGILLQVPVIYLTRIDFMRKKRWGNIVMWLIFSYGNPVIVVTYCGVYLSK